MDLGEERKETKDDDPIVEYSTGRNRYRMRESEARRIECMAESELAEWVEGQERMMSEEEYLKLLYKYREWLEAGGGRWQRNMESLQRNTTMLLRFIMRNDRKDRKMMVIRKLIKSLFLIWKCLVIMLLVAVLGLCLYIFAEVHFSQYEPRGYSSPYDTDVSSLFAGVGHDMDFAAKLDRIFALARSMGGVQGVTGITINFGEDNKVQSFTVTFQLESKWPFFGQMTVRANGTAVKEYIHWRYTGKEKILDTSWVLEQYCNCVNMVKEESLAVQQARISAGGIKLYSINGVVKELHNE